MLSHGLAALLPSSFQLDRVGDCVGRHLAVWGGWGSRPVLQECGILIWAICNDRPPMSTEEWQVERLWQVLIAVKKSSWRMCQLHPLLFLSSPIAALCCFCVSQYFFWVQFDLYFSKVSEGSLSFPILFSLPLFILADIQDPLPITAIPVHLSLPPPLFLVLHKLNVLHGCGLLLTFLGYEACPSMSHGDWQPAWFSVVVGQKGGNGEIITYLVTTARTVNINFFLQLNFYWGIQPILLHCHIH